MDSLTDSTPVDKINFIKAYTKARKIGMTSKNIQAGWRVTGNWPISRAKALQHLEIQTDKKEMIPKPTSYGIDKTPTTRIRYTMIAKGFENQV